MKLKSILEEVLQELNVPKPEDAYKFDDIKVEDTNSGRMYTYIYTNNLGQKMEVTNMVSKLSKEPERSIYVAFAKYEPDAPEPEHPDDEELKYAEKTGAKDMLKVLATVVEATKRTMKSEGGQENIYSILYSPADKKRANIYLHYLETLFPGFEKAPGQKGSFTRFINKDFKD